MNVRNIAVVLAVVVMSTTNVFAQGDFFWSTSELNSGATNSAADVGLNVGDTGSLYLYYSTANSEIDSNAGLDLSFTNNGVINFTAAETFNFAITVAGEAFGNRWASVDADGNPQGGFFGPALDVGPDSVTGLNAFRVTEGLGILAENTGPVFFDEGYDANAEAFLFARVEFVAVAEGDTSINTVAGAIGIVNGFEPINPDFGAANFTVTGIPEPTSAILLAGGMIGLVIRRRRYAAFSSSALDVSHVGKTRPSF